jgi:hypothetical protein
MDFSMSDDVLKPMDCPEPPKNVRVYKDSEEGWVDEHGDEEFVYEETPHYRYRADRASQKINILKVIHSDLPKELTRKPKTFRDVALGLSKVLGKLVHMIGKGGAVSDEDKREVLKDIFQPRLNVIWDTLDSQFEGPHPLIAYFFLIEVLTAYCKAQGSVPEVSSARGKRFDKLNKKIEEIFELIEEDSEVKDLAHKKCVGGPPFSRQVSLSSGLDYKSDLEFVFAMDDSLKNYYNDSVPSYGYALAKFKDELFELRDWGTIIKTVKERPGSITPQQLMFSYQLDIWFTEQLGADSHLYSVQSELAGLLFNNEIDSESLGTKLRRMHD